uniref:Uncharacterized protein n=1 Tax=Moniliophthora roreri TaxID=221103 RepID=A0A0W0FGU3_MONRR
MCPVFSCWLRTRGSSGHSEFQLEIEAK